MPLFAVKNEQVELIHSQDFADELAVSHNAVEKWKAGDRNPTNGKSLLMFLESLTNKKRIPKKRRYVSSSRRVTNIQGEKP